MIYAALVIIIATAITALLRGIPYLLLGGKNKIPDAVVYLSAALPPAIMVILVLYCLRNTKFTEYPYGISEILAVFITALIHIWKKNTVLSILFGTVCYMLLKRFVLT